MDAEARSSRWLELAFAVGGILVGALLILAVPDLRHSVSLALHGDLHGLRHQMRGLGASGVALILVLMLAHAVLFYPAEIVTATAGFVYGFLPGLALAVGGWLLSGMLAYFLGRAIGRPLLHAVFGRRRFERLERTVSNGGVTLLLAVRLIPIVPFSLIGYVAGAVGVRLVRFSWTTALGYLPLTAGIAYLGSRAQSLSVSDPLVWLIGAGLLGLIAAARLVDLEGHPKR